MSKDLPTFFSEQSIFAHEDGRKEQPLSGMRILLVDDSSDNQLLMKHLLTSLGAEIDAISDGKLAVPRVTTERFDAILLDLRMPDFGGDQTALAIRETGYRSPIIGLSAHLGPNEVKICTDCGFTICLERPVTREILVRVLLDSLKKI